MPSILMYVVHGYIFINVYNWISIKDSSDYKYILIKSIAASYIIKISFDYINNNYIKIGSIEYTVALICISAVLGFLLGKLVTNRSLNKFLNKLNIGRTTNISVWNDVIKSYTWVRIHLRGNNETYLGQFLYGEEYHREPIVVLATYQIIDKEGYVLRDYSQENNRLIMLNTKDFEKIEIVYDNYKKENIFNKLYNCYKNIKNKRKALKK